MAKEQIKKVLNKSVQDFCTQSRGRTGTPVKELVFETSASTNSAIWATLNWTAKVINCLLLAKFLID